MVKQASLTVGVEEFWNDLFFYQRSLALIQRDVYSILLNVSQWLHSLKLSQNREWIDTMSQGKLVGKLSHKKAVGFGVASKMVLRFS